jgi:hypothetical protein
MAGLFNCRRSGAAASSARIVATRRSLSRLAFSTAITGQDAFHPASSSRRATSPAVETPIDEERALAFAERREVEMVEARLIATCRLNNEPNQRGGNAESLAPASNEQTED